MYVESLEPRKLLAASTGTNLLVEYLTQSALRVDFDYGLGSSLTAADLQVANLTSSPETLVSSANIQLTYPGTDNATAVFKFINGPLLNGNYRGTISHEDASNGSDPLTGDVIGDNAISEQNFYILAGDANRDRTVDITDLAAVATNWQQSGKNWSEGDFNYDGVVDITDLSTVATNWQAILYELPQEPNVLTVSNPYASSNSVYLTWDASTPPAGATAWRIQRSSNGQTFQTYAEVDIAYSGFFDDGDDDPGLTGPGLPDGSRFHYRVRAINAYVEQAYTPKHGGTTTLPVPTIDSPTPLSSRKIKIAWTDNSQNATEFIVYRSPHGANDWDDIATVSGGAGDEYTDTDLSINTTYDYYVKARNSVTESGPSSFVDGTTMTLTEDMTHTVSELIANKEPSTGDLLHPDTLNLVHSDVNGNLTWNQTLWAAGIDLSCLPVWDSWSNQGLQDHGVLVTPVHLIQARHYGVVFQPDIGAMPPGTRVKFLSPDNEPVMATVLDNNPNDEEPDDNDPHQPGQGVADFYNGIVVGDVSADIRILELEWDDPIGEVMEKIAPAKVFPSDVTDFLPGLSSGIPVAFTNQFRRLHIANWNNFNASGVGRIGAVRPQGPSLEVWYQQPYGPVTGDSGSGVLALIGSTPVCLGTWYSSTSASNVARNVSAINAILTGGYSLTEFQVD